MRRRSHPVTRRAILVLLCVSPFTFAQLAGQDSIPWPGQPTTVYPEAGPDYAFTRLPDEHLPPPASGWQPPLNELPAVPFLDGSPAPLGSLWNWQTPPGRAPAVRGFERPSTSADELHLDFLARTFYLNDQRIEYFGTESTFGVEAILAPVFRRSCDAFEFELVSELYLNQPYDRNLLVDAPLRASFARNFDIEPFEISQLHLSLRRDDLMMTCGKMTTPFGRTWFPLFTNNRHDAPFIRTEAILWRETGLLLQWDPGNWVFTAMVTNGGPDQDANSSKAFVGRLGYDAESYSLGVSVKRQDGIGSENQKAYNNHLGIDARVAYRRWSLSGEWIFDQYGNRKPGIPLTSITWERSLYFRDLNKAEDEPISGTGYYVDLAYDGGRWTGHLNLGQYFPETIGDYRHDVNNTRAILGLVYHMTDWSQLYGMILTETGLDSAYELGPIPRGRKSDELLLGWQFTL